MTEERTNWEMTQPKPPPLVFRITKMPVQTIIRLQWSKRKKLYSAKSWSKVCGLAFFIKKFLKRKIVERFHKI